VPKQQGLIVMINIINQLNQKVKKEYGNRFMQTKIEKHIMEELGKSCNKICLNHKNDSEYTGFAVMNDGKLLKVEVAIYKNAKSEFELINN
jgi:hypothetical protein